MVERITKDGVSVVPVKYKQFCSSKIPHVINVSSRKFNFKGSFEVVSVSVSDQHVRNAADESDDNDKK
jgi:peroxiredoxin